MKIAIRYYTKTGNTKKLAEALSQVVNVEAKTVDEAIAFLEALKGIFLYTGVSEARTDRGQMRVDVNISLSKDDTLGTRTEMKNLNSFNTVKLAIEAAEKELGANGRVLVRASGTEPLVRVMLEGRDKEQIENLATMIAQIVEERLI